MSWSMRRARLSAALSARNSRTSAGCRDAAGEIEHHAAEEFLVGGERGVGNSVPLHFAEDLLVDEVPRRQPADRGRRRQSRGNAVCNCTGFHGFRRLKQRRVRRRRHLGHVLAGSSRFGTAAARATPTDVTKMVIAESKHRGPPRGRSGWSISKLRLQVKRRKGFGARLMTGGLLQVPGVQCPFLAGHFE